MSAASRPRRPLRTRGRASAAALAGWLNRRRIEPNEISVASVAIAAGGAACFAALKKLRASGKIDIGERVVIFNTGSGIKYLDCFE